MLVITVIHEIAQGQGDRFLERVRQQAEDALREEPGCHRFDVAADPHEAERFMLYLLFDDETAYEDHLAAAHTRAFEAEVAPITRRRAVGRWDLK